jgi:hypothetical protein
MSYVMYYKTVENDVEFCLVNNNNDVLLQRKYAFDDQDDITVYMREILLDVQSSLPKGHTINVKVVDLSDLVQA